MTHDLHQRYSAVQKVWEQADQTMVDVLDGETLSSFVLRSNLTKEERIEAEHKLKQTEYTQPAMLTADLAIERFLKRPRAKTDGCRPFIGGICCTHVCRHTRYGWSIASAARGTEMGSVVIDVQSLMASVMAPYNEVDSVLKSIEGYIIATLNKNSPKMTVIAGETEPVQQAMAQFEEKRIPGTLGDISRFHSRMSCTSKRTIA